VGLVPDPYWTDIAPEVDAACRAALRAASWETGDATLTLADLAGLAAVVRLTSEIGGRLPPAGLLATLAPTTRALLLYGSLWSGGLVTRADRVRAAVRRSVADLFDRFDVLAWPTSPATAPRLDRPVLDLPSGPVPVDVANTRQATLANLTGIPGVSIPVGFGTDGLPIGLQLLAPWGEEARLLDAAEHVEAVTGRRYVDAAPPAG
jgi:Asp-tRNA(Asn)/Glu-tRNA(Gln) amidotransferase A subunit family amidase